MVKNFNYEAIDKAVLEAIEQRAFPGAAVALGDKNGIFYKAHYGNASVFDSEKPCFEKEPEEFTGTIVPVTENTLYDMASCTKILSTTMVAFRMIDMGKIALYDSISRFIDVPEDKKDIEIRHLLTHTSGIKAHFLLQNDGRPNTEAAQIILDMPLSTPTGTKVEYTCMGYILLGKILEKVGGKPLDVLADELVFKPLGMYNTCYNPLDKGYTDIAVTEYEERLGVYKKGIVHDENACFMGGVSANAGVFSTAEDVAKLATMISSGGYHNGKVFISPSLMKLARLDMTGERGEGRGLGFVVKREGTLSAMGDLYPGGSFGHNGYTGTSMYIHGDNGLYVILLANRVHFTRQSDRIFRFRRVFHNLCTAEYEKALVK